VIGSRSPSARHPQQVLSELPSARLVAFNADTDGARNWFAAAVRATGFGYVMHRWLSRIECFATTTGLNAIPTPLWKMCGL
jgi:hypothetical protein